MTESYIEDLKQYFEKAGAAKVFVVCGKRSFELCGAKDDFSPLEDLYSFYYFNNYGKNISLEDLQQGIQEFTAFKPDVIIAVGGGSAIDMSKLIKAYAHNVSDLKSTIVNNQSYTIRSLPLVSLPTTAGSGSESTHFAVIYVDGVKYSVADKGLTPNKVLLVPKFIYKAPVSVMGPCISDALVQAIESYWAVGADDKSRSYARKALGKIIPNFKKAINGDKEARAELQQGAHFAGKAINISKTTAAHAYSYSLSLNYNIVHGHAVGLMLEILFRYVENRSDDSHKKLQSTLDELKSCLECDGQSLAVRWQEIMLECCLETSWWRLFGENESLADLVVENVNQQRLANNPFDISPQQLKELIVQKINPKDV